MGVVAGDRLLRAHLQARHAALRTADFGCERYAQRFRAVECAPQLSLAATAQRLTHLVHGSAVKNGGIILILNHQQTEVKVRIIAQHLGRYGARAVRQTDFHIIGKRQAAA